MVTYYAKPLEVLNDAIYDVNPALFNGLASRVGRLPLSVPDPWNTDYIHFNSIIKAVKMRVGDAPDWSAVPDSVPEPGLTKGKFFWWSHQLSEKRYKALQMDPSGMIAQQIKAELQAQQDYFASQVDVWLGGYLYGDTVDDYDAEWKGLAALSTASTVSDPNDACSTAGTADNYTATKMTGAATTVDALNTSIGAAKDQFYQQYDANTHQTMFKANNSFDLFVHPSVVEKFRRGHLSNASGELDYSRSLYEAMQGEVNVIPSFAFDAAYDGASATEAQGALLMNTNENFQVLETIPYTVEPWIYDPSKNIYKMRAYWKIFKFIRPYRIGSYWKKASQILRLTPYSNA